MKLPQALTLIVPSQGRPELRQCILSVHRQMEEEDNFIVGVDTFEDAEAGDKVEEIVREFDDPRISVVPHDAGHHCWGHCQLNAALDLVEDKHWVGGNDDDDVWLPTALDSMREEIAKLREPRPLLFRFKSYHDTVHWRTAGEFSQGTIGGHCGLFYKAKGHSLGQFTCRYEGDFDYLESTLALQGEPVWVDKLTALARPWAKPVPPTTPVPVTTLEQALEVAEIRNQGSLTFTRSPGQVTPEQQEKWWGENKDKVRLWLHYSDEPTSVGYSSLKPEGGKIWSAVALREQFRGQIGRAHV